MLIQGKEFTIGADPELFMGKDGKFVSAHDKIPGDKRHPFPVHKGAVQVDGMALEFNIDPASSFEEFSDNLDIVQSTLKEMIGDYDFLSESSVYFDKEFMKSIPHKNIVLGCMSDYEGWSLREMPPPNQSLMMRTAGGHIHIGGMNTDDPYEPKHFEWAARLSRMLDETIGVYSILWDKDDERRKMYGRASAFRPKKYGMEYRTLSNKWIMDKKLVKFVYEGVEEALEKMFSDYEPMEFIKGIINSSDRTNSFFSNNKRVALCT